MQKELRLRSNCGEKHNTFMLDTVYRKLNVSSSLAVLVLLKLMNQYLVM